MNPDAPSTDDLPPPKHSSRRLKVLLTVNALGLMLFAFLQLDRSTITRLGPWAESLYDAFHNYDPSAPSAAAKRFKAEVKSLRGMPIVTIVRPGFLGRIGRVENCDAVFRGPKYDGSMLHHLADSSGGQLHRLEIDNTNVTDPALQSLQQMPNLRELVIRCAQPARGQPETWTTISDAGLVHVGKLPRLQSLYLDGSPITDAGLASIQDLTELESLYLLRTEIRGPGLAQLKALPYLKTLHLDDAPLTDDGLKALAGATSLEDLSINGVALTAGRLPYLLAIPRLKQLQLSGSGLLDEELKALKQANPMLKIIGR
ncbi:leucine-rich repeat domain-containing protein [Paludisphaera rhizosphaerae]|uniref:leucine-rich repeat domain-containing protein n=1 Tax=Paludisphaera rhizosphaerae TaxID=2711216 RepID=UPI0013EB7C8A|nr:hypothetical protein [Paludisphaera rhizosphaerae]